MDEWWWRGDLRAVRGGREARWIAAEEANFQRRGEREGIEMERGGTGRERGLRWSVAERMDLRRRGAR